MKKRIASILLLLVLCLSMVVPAFAENGFADEYYRVIDMADLLTDDQEQALLSQLDEISLRQHFDVTVITAETLEGYTVQDYADALFEHCSYGYGDSRDGVLLLISMEDRDWYITTHGYGITAFTDAGIEYIGKQLKSDLSAGDYAAAFRRYGELCDDFVTQARSGDPYTRSNLPKEPLATMWLFISIGLGVAIALAVVGGMKGRLKTVRRQAAAASYLRPGSLQVTDNREMFLYTNVTQTARPKNDDFGSSTHTSSSGDTFGGGGGKF